MGIFRGIEKKLEGAVEGGFGRAFKSSVQPVEIAHKLAKEMADHKSVGVANVYVPNEFDVYLGRADYEQLVALADSLKAELSSYVVAYAQREGWTLVASPRIELHRDDDLRVGEFGIGTRTVSEPAGARGAVAEAPVVPASPAPGPRADQTVLYQQPAPVAAPAAAARRAVLRGPHGEWELKETVTMLGRSRRCDIVVEDPNVSREHAEIRRQQEGYVVRDLGSTNGLRVNRQNAKCAVLQHGDRIQVGATEFVFQLLP
ncbi:MAG: DUF3662 and FHA domain-containing protein [Thermoleophilia bacterium]